MLLRKNKYKIKNVITQHCKNWIKTHLNSSTKNINNIPSEWNNVSRRRTIVFYSFPIPSLSHTSRSKPSFVPSKSHPVPRGLNLSPSPKVLSTCTWNIPVLGRPRGGSKTLHNNSKRNQHNCLCVTRVASQFDVWLQLGVLCIWR